MHQGKKNASEEAKKIQHTEVCCRIQNYSLIHELHHEGCVSRHENSMNLIGYLQQSSWVITHIVNEQ